MSKKRNSIEITDEANDVLERIKDWSKLPKNHSFERIVRFFETLPREVQAAALMTVPQDMQGDLADAMLKRLKKSGSGGASTGKGSLPKTRISKGKAKS